MFYGGLPATPLWLPPEGKTGKKQAGCDFADTSAPR